MKCSKLVAVLMLVITLAVSAYAAEPAKGKTDAGEIGAIAAVVKAHAAKEVIESVYVDKIVGDYAEAIVSVKDGDGGMAYLKKAGAAWTVLFYGNAMTEAALVDLGVPQDVAKKLSD